MRDRLKVTEREADEALVPAEWHDPQPRHVAERALTALIQWGYERTKDLDETTRWVFSEAHAVLLDAVSRLADEEAAERPNEGLMEAVQAYLDDTRNVLE